MFGIGWQELIIIAIVALLIVGPKKLPDLAKTLGKGFKEFKNATDGITENLKESLKEDEKPKEDPINDAAQSPKSEMEEAKKEPSGNEAGAKQNPT
jgi:Tat protein translocase TatB subunit